jgi:DNA-binding transcriptional ArsR family regulator
MSMGPEPESFAERQRASALRHPVRRRIFSLLERESANVDEIAGRLEVPRGTAAYHVRFLSRLQLIDVAEGEDTFQALRLRYEAVTRHQNEGTAPKHAEPQREVLADMEDALASATAAMESGTLLGVILPSIATLEVDLDEDAWPEVVAIVEEAVRHVQELAERTELRREKQDDLLVPPGSLIPIAFTIMGYEAAPPP